MFRIIDEPSSLDVRDKGQNKKTVIDSGRIEFRDAVYRDYTGKKLINKVSLIVPAGSKIGLVGHSGSGKSTLCKLLMRYDDLTSGSLMIDDVPIQDYDALELRRQIALVEEDPNLFNTMIKDNIIMGDLNATDSKVRHAADLANALPFIESEFETLPLDEKLAQVRKDMIEVARVA